MTRTKSLLAGLVAALCLPCASSQETIILYAKHVGSLACPCIDSSVLLSSQSDCTVNGEPGIEWQDECLSVSYGASECSAWDYELRSVCSNKDTTLPAFCEQSWCFVDGEKCRASQQRFYQSELLPQLYYSYSTCGSSAQAWRNATTMDATNGASLTAAIPVVHWPAHYKADQDTGQLFTSDSAQAYDNSLPWQGYMIDYLNDVLRYSNIHSVSFVHRSGGSQTTGYDSKYTQAVTDVQAGIVDLAVSTFWVTPERLAIAPFTTPFATDKIKLWVPLPKTKPLSFAESNLQQLALPFSNQLWVTLSILFVLYVILSAKVSQHQYNRPHWKHPPTSSAQIIHRIIVRWIDSFNIAILQLLGHGVSPQRNSVATPAQKWLNLGFAILAFLFVVAYTANLAAFFTVQAAATTITTMEQAMAQNIPICAPTVLQPELTNQFPTYPHWKFRTEERLLQQAYDNQVCQAIVNGFLDIRADPQAQTWYCQRGLVRVGTTILDKLLAFPAQSNILSGLSHWIVHAQQEGILFDHYVTQVEQLCPLDWEQTNPSDNNSNSNNSSGIQSHQLTVANMTVPIVIFVICCVLALFIHSLGGGGERNHSNFKTTGRALPSTDPNARSAHKRVSVHFIQPQEVTLSTASDTTDEEIPPFKSTSSSSSKHVAHRTAMTTMRKTTEINTVAHAQQTMEELMDCQRKLFLRMQHLSRQEEKARQQRKRKQQQQVPQRPTHEYTESEN